MNRFRFAVSSLVPPILAGVGGCRDATAPPEVLPAAVTGVTANVVSSPPTLGIFDDAQARLLPAMADQVRRVELEKLLQQVAAAYNAGDLVTARRASAAAQKVLDRMASSEHPANISAIRLGLLNAEALLSADGQSAGQQ
jgi:hypothetical protein